VLRPADQGDDRTIWKNLTTPAEPIDGVLEGLGRVDDVKKLDKLRLGTTIATNALLTRRGAKVAYVTTSGFRDVPFIQRGDRRSHYDITWIKTKPLVARRNCHEVSERLSAKGEVVEALDEAAVRALAQKIKAEGTHRGGRRVHCSSPIVEPAARAAGPLRSCARKCCPSCRSRSPIEVLPTLEGI
jgi:N-methylhydantoinase A/oxoprolinase/acetone carboxylase beta subunit